MTRDEFDNAFSLYQLSELIEQLPSNRKVRDLLHTFSCTINIDLEDFLHNKALTFEKHLRSRTYLYIDNEIKKVAAYFTIAISTLHTDNISSETIKILDGYQDNTKSIPCFLIGQLGKSDKYKDKKIGEFILEDSIDIIDNLHYAVGGRFILLDAINAKEVVEFYKNSLFFPIEISDENVESIKMIRPYFEELE
jgi:hypothetical protein